jgi:predicted amidophosphoribosyltransferase
MNVPLAGVKFPRRGLFMENNGFCPSCNKPSSSLIYSDGDWFCRHCVSSGDSVSCRLFEFGHENPIDAKGSTAHVRDIRDRRWHPQEKRMFYYSKELGKTYFFPK